MVMTALPRVATSIALVISTVYAIATHAAEIRVMAGGPLAAVFKEIVPRFEVETGHKIVPRFSGTAVVRKEVNAGEAFDLVITDASSIDGCLISRSRKGAAAL